VILGGRERVADHHVPPGYALGPVIGRGATGTVFAATQLSLQRPVALKLLHPDVTAEPAVAERFVGEASQQGAFEHPNILTVYDAGICDGAGFIAMQLVQGGNLQELLDAGRLPAARALRLLAQVADALDALHDAGTVHRDVTPRNILVGRDDHAYLADFGLAREFSAINAPGVMLGTRRYAAPEQVRGDAATPASDVYALAATSFACLTGRPPFADGADGVPLSSAAPRRPPRASAIRNELPASVDDVFAAGLANETRLRPASAGNLIAGLTDALGAQASRLPSPARRERRAVARTAARRKAASLVAVIVVFGSAAVLWLGGQGGVAGAERQPAPHPLAGTDSVGSELAPGAARGVGCGAPNPTCTIELLSLGGAPVRFRADGAIRAWAVRGASGPIALDLIGGTRTRPIGELQTASEYVPDPGVHRYPVLIPVRRGQWLGVELGPGATIGVRASQGDLVRRWGLALGPQGLLPGQSAAAGSQTITGQLLLQVAYAPGRSGTPPQLDGPAAERLSPGTRLAQTAATLPQGDVIAAVVRAEGRLAVDLYLNGRRYARAQLPQLDPKGVVDSVTADDFNAATGSDDITINWANAGGHVVAMTLRITARGIVALS
jgi:serine/threonine-protein kinase